MIRQMRTIEFKAKFDKVIKSLQITGEPVVITKNGKPHVKVVPIEPGDDTPGLDTGKLDKGRKTKRSVRRQSRKGHNG
jgi:prevent-host-death family protein